MGRWVLWGWIALIVIVVGLVLGFVLYTRIIIGIGLKEQAAILQLPEELVVQTRTTDLAAITLQGQVDVAVPFKDEGLALPLKGSYRTLMSLDTEVPLRMVIEYNDVIPVETSVSLDTDASLVSPLLPRLPIRGDIPLTIDVPVSLTIPVDTVIRFVYDGPVLVGMDQTIYPAVDEILHTSITLGHDVDAPVTNIFNARVVPDNRSMPIILTDTKLTLPLRDLNIFQVEEGRPRAEPMSP